LTVGKQARKKQDRRNPWRRRRGESPESAEFRRHLLADAEGSCEGLYRRRGSVRLNGVPVPFVEPTRWFEDPVDFDRCVCANGLVQFCRHAFPGERLNCPVADGVLVREIRPGVRMRLVYMLARASA
jgi:hypothetical protein